MHKMYYHCYIEGRTDYIFGDRDVTAYFRDCTIHTLGADQDKNGGYVACNKGSKVDLAYIFDGCTFEADAATEVEGVKKGVADATVSLGRTWDADMRLVIMNSTISSAYATADFKAETEGGKNTRYTEMNKDKSPSKTKIFEYNNSGDGAITSAQAANYISVSVLSEISEDNAKYVTNDFAKMFSNNGTKEWSDSATWVNPFLFMQTTSTTYLFEEMGLTQVEPVVVTVEFNGTSYHFVTVKNGYISEKQVKTVLANYIMNYGGSYSNEECSTGFDFTAKVTAATTIYTKYQDGFQVAYTMSYNATSTNNDGWEANLLSDKCYVSTNPGDEAKASNTTGLADKYVLVQKLNYSDETSYIKSPAIMGKNVKSVDVSIFGATQEAGDALTLNIVLYNSKNEVIGSKKVSTTGKAAGGSTLNNKKSGWCSETCGGSVDENENHYITVEASEQIAYFKIFNAGEKFDGHTTGNTKKFAVLYVDARYTASQYDYNFDFNASDTEEADTAMEKNYQVADNLLLQGSTGTGTIGDDFLINVDATNGKLAARKDNGDTQFNQGTKLSFVAPYNCEIELNLVAGSASINGVTNGAKKIVQQFATGTPIEIVSLGSSYLTSLSIKKVESVTPFAATAITAVTTTTELAQNGTFDATTLTVKAMNATTGYYKTLATTEYTLSVIDTTTTGEKTVTVTYGELTTTFSFEVVASVDNAIRQSMAIDYNNGANYSSEYTTVNHSASPKAVSTSANTTVTYDKITYGNGAATNGSWLIFNTGATISFEVAGSTTMKICFYSGTPNVEVKLGTETVTTSTSTEGANHKTAYVYSITGAGTVTITATGNGYLGFIEIALD